MSKAPPLKDFPKDVQNTVYDLLAKAAVRRAAKALKEKGDISA